MVFAYGGFWTRPSLVVDWPKERMGISKSQSYLGLGNGNNGHDSQCPQTSSLRMHWFKPIAEG
jgi:hypothetical protein